MKLYERCSELPLSRFIRCICEGDYSALLIEGEAPAETLKSTWETLYEEYLDLTANTGNNEVLQLLNEFDGLFYKYAVIENCVEILRVFKEDDLVAILRSRGFNFPFDHNDTERYLKDLDRVMVRAKKILVDMDIRRKQLESIQKASEGTKIDRPYFDTILVTLSKFAGFHVNEDIISVSRYAALLNMYITHCKQVTAENNVRAHR